MVLRKGLPMHNKGMFTGVKKIMLVSGLIVGLGSGAFIVGNKIILANELSKTSEIGKDSITLLEETVEENRVEKNDNKEIAKDETVDNNFILKADPEEELAENKKTHSTDTSKKADTSNQADKSKLLDKSQQAENRY